MVHLSLRLRQSDFTRNLAVLIQYAFALGYEVTIGEVQSYPAGKRHIKGSFHYKKLAVDLNLFINGNYVSSSAAHEPLGLFWESLGGTWGGRFRDGNHYSWGE